MANGYVSSIQLPNDNTYNIKDKEIIPRLKATVGHSNKNLLRITANTQTINGVTFTVDKQAGTVTANGTASKYTVFGLISPSSFYQERGMILSGCTGGSQQTYWIDTWDGSVQVQNYSGETSISTQSWTQVRIIIRQGVSVSNLVFKPMIRDGSISDDTFEPYQEPTDSLIETKTRAYLTSTVGHVGKNQLSFGSQNLTKTIAGVTFTVDPVAGTVIANGTSTSSNGSQYFIRIVGKGEFSSLSNYPTRSIPNGKYYFCGCPSGGSFGKGTYNVYVLILETNTRAKKWDGSTNVDTDYGVKTKNELLINDQSSTLLYSIRVFDTNGQNKVFRPMIWSADISDDSFEPYQEPTDSLIETKARAYLTSTVGHVGKNYISYDTSTYTYTLNGITFTLDPSAGTVTANGTATANTEFRIPFNHIMTISGGIVVYTKKPIKSGKYYFCGCPSGGTSTSYYCIVYDNTVGSIAKKWNGTSGADTDFGGISKNEMLIDDTHSQRFTISIKNGYTASNLVFRPMIWSGDIDDDTFEPYIEPTDSLIETKARAYLNSTVGHACKNLLDLTKYTYSSGISNVVTDEATGSLSFTGTGTNKAVNVPAAFLGMEMFDGKTYTVSCVNNLASTTTGRLAIRREITNDVVNSVSFNTTGNKSITFTADEETFPHGWYISVMATGSTSTTGKIDISNFMLREASITDDTFEPYQTPTDEAKMDKPVELVSTATDTFTYPSVSELKSKYSMLAITAGGSQFASFASVTVPTSIIYNVSGSDSELIFPLFYNTELLVVPLHLKTKTTGIVEIHREGLPIVSIIAFPK